jgi:hypothetical protein
MAAAQVLGISFNFKSKKICFFFNLERKTLPFGLRKNSKPILYPIFNLSVWEKFIISFNFLGFDVSQAIKI